MSVFLYEPRSERQRDIPQQIKRTSGDILSGIVGSLLAQGIKPAQASRIAVALHAKAADMAAESGEKGLLATDLLAPLRQLVNIT